MINLRSYVAGATRRIIQARQFSLSSRACQENASEKPSTAATPPKTDARDLKTLHHLSNFEKKILVWTKRYKTIEEIPETVHYETLERARQKFRIKVCNYMLVATIFGCIAMIISGKRAAKRGDSVQKQNQDWHARYNEQKEKEEKLQQK